jgi:hypothetical protein
MPLYASDQIGRHVFGAPDDGLMQLPPLWLCLCPLECLCLWLGHPQHLVVRQVVQHLERDHEALHHTHAIHFVPVQNVPRSVRPKQHCHLLRCLTTKHLPPRPLPGCPVVPVPGPASTSARPTAPPHTRPHAPGAHARTAGPPTACHPSTTHITHHDHEAQPITAAILCTTPVSCGA